MRRFVQRHPFTANALVAAVCTSCGDWIVQLGTEGARGGAETESSAGTKKEGAGENTRYDMRRNLAFTAFGAIWSVPGRMFYMTLARYVPTNTLTGAIKGALIGELGMDVPISCPLYITFTDFMRGRDTDFIFDHLKRDYLGCAVSSFCLWTPATVVNLRLVPLQYRVIFDSVFVVVWNAILSFYTNRKTAE